MKFLVDAQLPHALCILLREHGLDAVHTRELPLQNATSDNAINELSIQEGRIVISKDTDFYYSHLLHRKPFKLYSSGPATSAQRILRFFFRGILMPLSSC